MAKRKTLGKKVRFEIFKRDSFTCQYCGKKAPDAILHVDHIEPVAEGGTSELLNLITSCLDCNLGKGARRLSDRSAIAKQHSQLKELQERREQLEMMVSWQKGLMSLELDAVDLMVDFWRSVQPGSTASGLNEYARGEMRKWLRKHSVEEVMNAMREAADKKMTMQEDGAVSSSSLNEAFHFVPRLLRVLAEQEKEPYVRDAYYIRGILRRRFGDDVIDWEAKRLILDVLNAGSSVEVEKEWAAKATSYWNWKNETLICIRKLTEDGDQS